MDLRDYRVQGPIPSCVDAWGVVHAVEGSGMHGGCTECGEQFVWAAADLLLTTGLTVFAHPISKVEFAVTCMWCVVAPARKKQDAERMGAALAKSFFSKLAKIGP